MVSRFFTILCIFFSKRAEKGIFHAWKSQWLGDTLVIHFSYETQLMIVNCIVAAQGYQIQATRWRELSILLGARWYIFNVITFFTELTHQSDAELVRWRCVECITTYHRGVSPDLGWVIQVFRYKSISPDLGWVIRFPRYKIVSPNLTLD